MRGHLGTKGKSNHPCTTSKGIGHLSDLQRTFDLFLAKDSAKADAQFLPQINSFMMVQGPIFKKND